MGIIKKLCFYVLSAFTVCTASASDFFSTESPESMLGIGVRVGVNTSNITMNNKIFDKININSWGTGFDAGVVVDLNIRDYISVQPGIFYQSRSGNYWYEATDMPGDGMHTPEGVQMGHLRHYNLNIPIVASLHFNVAPEVRWNVDLGPYMGIKLWANDTNKISYSSYDKEGNIEINPLRTSGIQFGLKMGTSLRILRHYVVGVHYMAGMTHAWKDSYAGGRDKCWTFTIGYDF